MLKASEIYGHRRTEVQMVQNSPSNIWFRTVAPPVQADDTKWVTAPTWHCVNNVSRTHLPKINYRMPSCVSTGNRPLTASHPPVVSNEQCLCNFLAQLQGNFWDKEDGGKLQIVLTDNCDKQRAIVRRVCSAGEDRVIYDEDSRFTLCSLNGDVEAVMLKGGRCMKALTWWRNDGKPMPWRRLDNKPGSTDWQDLSRISREFSEEELAAEGVCNRPAVPELEGDSINDPNNQSNNNEALSPSAAIDQIQFDNELFSIFRTHFEDSLILQNFLDWGITRTPNHKVGEEEIRELSTDRLWVSVRLTSGSSKHARKLFAGLRDLKGAYQKVAAGVYTQPAPEPGEPGVQHRLRNLTGYWVIEAFDVDRWMWHARTQQFPNGEWVDLTSGLKLYNIQVIPMINILNRMKDDWSECNEMKKHIEFLFSTCNQKKLNTKLKPRSLKHHIDNLRVKLEKQYALSFAVRVAKVADSIALNLGKEAVKM